MMHLTGSLLAAAIIFVGIAAQSTTTTQTTETTTVTAGSPRSTCLLACDSGAEHVYCRALCVGRALLDESQAQSIDECVAKNCSQGDDDESEEMDDDCVEECMSDILDSSETGESCID